MSQRTDTGHGTVRLVDQLTAYQQLVVMVATMLNRRGFRAHTIAPTQMLEVVTTVPPAIRLLEAQNWPGYFPDAEQRKLFEDIRANMQFIEARCFWTGEELVVQARCEHGNAFYCIDCRNAGRVRLDGAPY